MNNTQAIDNAYVRGDFGSFNLQGFCQRQSKSEPKGSAKCCHFGVGEIAA